MLHVSKKFSYQVFLAFQIFIKVIMSSRPHHARFLGQLAGDSIAASTFVNVLYPQILRRQCGDRRNMILHNRNTRLHIYRREETRWVYGCMSNCPCSRAGLSALHVSIQMTMSTGGKPILHTRQLSRDLRVSLQEHMFTFEQQVVQAPGNQTIEAYFIF